MFMHTDRLNEQSNLQWLNDHEKRFRLDWILIIFLEVYDQSCQQLETCWQPCIAARSFGQTVNNQPWKEFFQIHLQLWSTQANTPPALLWHWPLLRIVPNRATKILQPQLKYDNKPSAYHGLWTWQIIIYYYPVITIYFKFHLTWERLHSSCDMYCCSASQGRGTPPALDPKPFTVLT